MRTYTNWDFISAFGGVAEMPDGTPVVLQADAAGALKVADADLLAELKLVALATAQHVTDATSAAAVDVACADGTRFVEGYCESSFYYKRAAGAAATDTLHPAGRFSIPMTCAGAAGVFSILVTSATDVRLDAVPMGVA